jgi:hypothetical protein
MGPSQILRLRHVIDTKSKYRNPYHRLSQFVEKMFCAELKKALFIQKGIIPKSSLVSVIIII